MSLEVAEAIRRLGSDNAIKEAVRRAREFQPNDSAV